MKTDIKKAITIIDDLSEVKKRTVDGMKKICKDWSGQTGVKGLALDIARDAESEIIILQRIRECIVEKPKRKKVEKDKSK